MKEAVNKVRQNDNLEDNTAALELVAESSERLSNSVDRNTERNKRLEQRLADMGQPVHRYSKDKPEQVQSVQQASPTVINQPKSEQETKPKIEKKKPDDVGFFNTISNAGKTFAGEVLQAGADFGKSMTDQIGSELLPFYSDMKAAASKVTGGAVVAGKAIKSKFEMSKAEKKEKKTGIIPQAIVDKTEKTEKVTELKEKMRDRRREHAEHKLYKKVDDIHDLLRNMMLVNLLKAVVPDFGSFGTAIGKFAGMFARGGLIAAFFAGLKAWGSKFIDASLKQISSAFSSITSGIKDTFTKSVDAVKDGWKKLTEPKKVETATPKSKPTVNPDVKPDTKPKPVLDKDGKPKLDKAGKPMFEKPVVPDIKKTPDIIPDTKPKISPKMPKSLPIATAATAAEAAATAESAAALQLAEQLGLKTAISRVGTVIAAIETAAEWISYLTGQGEDYEKFNSRRYTKEGLNDINKAQTAAAGEKLSFTGAAKEYNKEEWDALPKAEREQKRKHEENLTNVYKSIAAAQGSTGGNTANTVINNTTVQNAPMWFPRDGLTSSQAHAAEQAYRNMRY